MPANNRPSSLALQPPPGAAWYAYGIALVFGFPLFWMVVSSFKTPAELSADPFRLIPASFTWSNYTNAVRAMPFARYLVNTLLLCGGTVLGTLLSCSLAAYGFARLRWRGRDVCFGLVLATMLLPWHVTMIPRFLLIRELGLYNSLWSIIAPTFLGEAFYIFLLRQFFLKIPESISEAARLDGLSEWRIFWQMILPLSKPALAAVAVFQFAATWNNFSAPLLYLSDPEKFPLTYGLERFSSAYADQTHLLLAGATLFTAPMVLLFLLAQRTFVEGVSMTGMK